MTPHIKRIVLPIHLLALLSLGLLFSGIVATEWLWATFCGWILISGFGVAIGFHRLLSHRAFNTYAWVRHLLAYLGCLGAQGSPIFWACVHRGLHHPFSDTEKDLHSPVKGYWHAYMGWQFTLSPKDVPFRATTDLNRDPVIKFLHKRYYSVYWLSFAVVAIFDFRLALFGLGLPALISMHAENMIDLFCHLPACGYRNHDIDDRSVNVPLLGYFDWGQGWHNNHHARPNDYNFGGERWFEIDPCAFIVPLLMKRSRPLNEEETQSV